MRPLLIIDVVGLTPRLIGENTPAIAAIAARGFMSPLDGTFPALTCSAQTSMLTGLSAKEHGVVGNGWYFRDLGEVFLWRQSNALVRGERLWEAARRIDPAVRTANVFWWYAMNSSVDTTLTPRPLYFADGKKEPGVYGLPQTLRRAIEDELGPFPLFEFWGPRAGIRSSKWIADATKATIARTDPALSLSYLPHLDYDFQRYGPDDPRSLESLRAIDRVVGDLAAYASERGRDVLIVSEYGIEKAQLPVHVNRILRRTGFLETTPMLDRELLDTGASRAFAVADHQIAHVYVRSPKDIAEVRRALTGVPGIAEILDRKEQAKYAVDHERSGDLVLVAAPGAWFTYYYWDDDRRAPDFARTVDIHKKPGYDPVELFVDPAMRFAGPRIAWRVLKKKLGFRMLMDVIPLDAGLVRGTHGRLFENPLDGAVAIGTRTPKSGPVQRMQDVKAAALELLFDG